MTIVGFDLAVFLAAFRDFFLLGTRLAYHGAQGLILIPFPALAPPEEGEDGQDDG
jgi:hypothetical protein